MRAAPPKPAKADKAAPAGGKKDAAKGEEPKPGPGESGQRGQDGQSRLTVTVPADAKITINGHLTSTPGAHREFIARKLAEGNRYAYRVRAEITRDGKKLTETKVVRLIAGADGYLVFDFDGTLAADRSENTSEKTKVAPEGSSGGDVATTDR